jgi:hypothetical protein
MREWQEMNMADWLQFAQKQWIFGGVVASLLWFLAGRQSLSDRQAGYAAFWQGIALFIAVVLCVWAVLEKQWLGLISGLAVLSVEALLMKRSYTKRAGDEAASASSRL